MSKFFGVEEDRFVDGKRLWNYAREKEKLRAPTVTFGLLGDSVTRLRVCRHVKSGVLFRCFDTWPTRLY